MKLCGQNIFFSPGQNRIKNIDNRSPHHDRHPLHLMDHPGSCWSVEIAPNQSEVSWALAGLVPKPTCCFRSQMWTLSKPWGPCLGGPWLNQLFSSWLGLPAASGMGTLSKSWLNQLLHTRLVSTIKWVQGCQPWILVQLVCIPKKIHHENADDSDCRKNYWCYWAWLGWGRGCLWQ